jgi:hypothetical protein
MAEVQSLFVANEKKLSQEVLRPGANQIDQSRRFPRAKTLQLWARPACSACLFLLNLAVPARALGKCRAHGILFDKTIVGSTASGGFCQRNLAVHEDSSYAPLARQHVTL